MLQGAFTGVVTAGFSPDIFSSTIGTLKYLGQQTLSAVMPSYDLSIGSFDFSVSPSIAFGNGWGFGANLSVTFRAGEFSISGGFGLMNYGSHAGSGKSGWEYRRSAMFSYDSKSFSFKLGTNSWKRLHPQQTGILGFGFGKFSLTYENDGFPFAIGIGEGVLADNNDSHRTAAMRFRIGKFQGGFNLFTGERKLQSYAKYNGADKSTMAEYNKNNPLTLDGIKYYNGLVEEIGPRYRLGAAYVGWEDYRIGIDSDQYVRRPIQNRLSHDIFKKQPGFEVLSKGVKPYFQYQTRNNFTSW